MKDFLLSVGNDIFHHEQNCWLKPSTMSKGRRKLQQLWRNCGNTAPVLTAMLGRLCLNSKILLGNIDLLENLKILKFIYFIVGKQFFTSCSSCNHVTITCSKVHVISMGKIIIW